MNGKKVIILFFFTALVINLYSQKHENPEEFLNRLELQFSERNPTESASKALAHIAIIKSALSDGRMEAALWEKLMNYTKRMESLRMRPQPHLATLLAMVAQNLNQTDKYNSLNAWLLQLEQLLSTRDTRPVERFLDQTSLFLYQRRIAGRGSVNWYLREGEANFVFDTALVLQLSNATISCANQRDSLRIYQTSGMLLFSSQIWLGQSGKAGWERFGIPLDEAYVELGDYSIDMSRALLTASPVKGYFAGRISGGVQGSFEDQVYSSPPNERTPHPRFKSIDSRLLLRNIYEGVDYRGNILMQGKWLYGDGNNDEPATLIFRRGSRLLAVARAQRFDLSRQQTQALRTSLSLYFEADSLYHPGLNFRYDNERRQIIASRSREGVARAPFSSTYHLLHIASEALYWNIDEQWVQFRSLEGPGQISKASLSSQSFFSEQEFRRLQLIDEIHPMYVIERYLKETGAGDKIPLNFLASYMRKPPEQVVSLVLNLVERGYMLYDSETNTIDVLPAFRHALSASAGKEDFDVLRLNSETTGRNPNFLLNLVDFSLTAVGVNEVVLSEKQGVQLIPEAQKLTFGQNRDFSFKGHVRAGLFDFYAREAIFEYDSFSLNFTRIDSLAFAVLRNDLPPNSPPEYVKVRNVIADLTGTLRIDEPKNKSGKHQLSEFPSFTSSGESYVYFDKPDIQQGTLKRDSFFYVVDPFRIDSLSNFSTENFRITGYLNSGKIFPVIREQLNVMPDYALGFTHKIPDEGYPVYEGKAQYYTEVSLSGEGFVGKGRLQYQTSNIFSQQFRFYPDSVAALADSWQMTANKQPVSLPEGNGQKMKLKWDVGKNIARLTTLDAAAHLYATAAFLGVLELSPQGANGAGLLSFEKANVRSQHFRFFERNFEADMADFSLMPASGSKPAFLANHYRVLIDFDQRKGDFAHLGPKSKLSFPFNQYSCTLDEAIWFMDDNRIALNNRKMADRINLASLNEYQLIDINLSGSDFISEHPDQGGLSFFSLEADYDLNQYAIMAKNVKILKVADAAIFPTDGKITVLQDARMLPLESALIIADTLNKLHRIENARVEVVSRTSYMASGNYAYRDLNGEVTIIRFNEIRPDNTGVSMASGNISPETPLKLNPWFAFIGEVRLSANLRTLRFSGAYKTEHGCFESAAWVRFDTLVDPNNVRLPLLPVMYDLTGNRVYSGLFYSAAQDRYKAYMLQNSASAEALVSSVSGVIYFDKPTLTYKVESTNDALRDYLMLQTNRCVIAGMGEIDLGLRLPLVELAIFGNYNYKLIPDSLYLDVSIGIKFPVDDKLMGIITDSLSTANLPGAALTQGTYLFAAQKLIGQSESERLNNEIALYGSPRRLPEGLAKTLFFSNVRLKWNPSTRSFVSMGALSLANINRNMVNKTIEGFIELEQSRATDGFSIHLMPSARQWFFFTYRSGLMQMLSSSDTFNTTLAAIKDDKRQFVDGQGDKYEYTLANRRRMLDFLRKMQNIEY